MYMTAFSLSSESQVRILYKVKAFDFSVDIMRQTFYVIDPFNF